MRYACAWEVQIEDGTHIISAEVSGLPVSLKIRWDEDEISASRVWWFYGDLTAFEHSGHSFKIRRADTLVGFVAGSLALWQDGVEIGLSERHDPGDLNRLIRNVLGVLGPVGSAVLGPVLGPARKTEDPKAPARTASTPPVSPVPTVQFKEDRILNEADEVVDVVQYSIDNRFGDQPIMTEKQVSRETTNELSVDTLYKAGVKISGEIEAVLIAKIKGELEAEISRQTGRKIGEKVTESQTVKMSVGPRASVLYQVIWKRRVRNGERVYLLGDDIATVPYKVSYGLSCAVRTEEPDA
jgi:hypothetical protein